MIEQYADIIRARRTALSMSRRQLAQKANVGEAVIWRLERHSCLPRAATLYRIMGALGLNPTTDDSRSPCDPIA